MKTDIYLAGGFYANNWQEKVEQGVRHKVFKSNTEGSTTSIIDHTIGFHNPKSKERGIESSEAQQSAFKNPVAYTTWDLAAINKSDLVFAYIDKENPAVGVIAEVGYAVGKSKPVILVIDSDHTYFKDRYFDFLRNMPGVVHFKTLEEGIGYTQAYLQVI